MNKEYRNIDGLAADESRKVSGCAVKFNSDSQDMGYIERILPSAITQDTINKSDIYATLNHKEDAILARSRYGKGSLTLELRKDGLYYSFDAPNTQYGDELLEHIKRGEISTSSFAFTIPEDGSGDKWYTDDDGNFRRDIVKIDRLFDCSPVYEPAYLATSCVKRSFEAVKQKSEEISKKYDNFLAEIDTFSIL